MPTRGVKCLKSLLRIPETAEVGLAAAIGNSIAQTAAQFAGIGEKSVGGSAPYSHPPRRPATIRDYRRLTLRAVKEASAALGEAPTPESPPNQPTSDTLVARLKPPEKRPTARRPSRRPRTAAGSAYLATMRVAAA